MARGTATLFVVALLLGACGADDGTGGAAGEPAPTAEAATFGPWTGNDSADEPVEVGDDGGALDEAAEGLESGAEAGGADDRAHDVSVDGGLVEGTEELTEAVDPCGVLSADEWRSWARDASGEGPAPIEGGLVCGWRDGDDRRRVAIGVFEVLPDDRWLDAESADGHEDVSQLGDRATWLAEWPVPQSSTLVVEHGDVDVVIELSARDGTTQSQLRDEGIRLARLVLGRF